MYNCICYLPYVPRCDMCAHPNNDKKKIMAGTKDSIVTIITKEKKLVDCTIRKPMKNVYLKVTLT